MTCKPLTWFPFAVALSGINLVFVGYAAAAAEPWHAGAHVALALLCAVWARRLLGRLRSDAAGSEFPAGRQELEAVEDELGRLRRELTETQERLDFTERLLAQRAEAHR